MVGSNHLWLLNVCFVGPEVGSDLSDARLLDRAKLLCFCAVGGPLPLPTKPLSDCQAVKRSPITTGNSGFKVPVYSAHAATLQRLVITICSGFLHSSPLGFHFFPVFFRLSVHPSSIYRIYFLSVHFPPHPFLLPPHPPSVAPSPLSSKQSLFKLSFALRVLWECPRCQTLLKKKKRSLDLCKWWMHVHAQ